MQLALIALGVISLIEGLLWFPPLWYWRRIVAIALIVPLAVSSGLLFGAQPAFWTGSLLLVSLYRLVNLLRVIEHRPHADFLYVKGRRTSGILIGSQLALLAIGALQTRYDISGTIWLYGLIVSQCACALMLLGSTLRHLRTTKPATALADYTQRDLPTLSVLIPARNETDDLEACLRSLIASDYPKLEVLVLDDCSQLKRTPEIIRTFAHDGVRFLSGTVPPERWLAKNYAYKQLAEAANGEMLLFCGVDVRFSPSTLRVLVASMLQRKKYMLSVVPHNEPPLGHSLDKLLLQPGRYAWELALPRRLFNRPPVLSTCWLIYRDLLNSAGGFDAVSRSISPESYFARQAVRHDDGYSFLHSDNSIGLVCLKSIGEQRATAVRTRYPQLHRRPELVMSLSLMELAWVVAPFVLLVIGLNGGHWGVALGSAFNCLLLLIFFAQTITFTYRTHGLSGCWLLPAAALYDVALLNISMWQYEFNEVIWKNRNVCIPVMHVVPTLPKDQ